MSTYLLINIVIIIFPLLFSFNRFMPFYKRYPKLFITIFLVGLVFVSWDVFATVSGHWSFNNRHIGGIKFFGLPVEEILFFITVPYSCLFLYESLRKFLLDAQTKIHTNVFYFLAAISFITSLVAFSKPYSSIAAFACGSVFLTVRAFNEDLFKSGIYWFFMFLSSILFLIFNYLLTSIPVVMYAPSAISNIRMLTIPVEDFLYNFAMLTAYLAVYLRFTHNSDHL